jgi:hypothetical protein
MKERIVSAQTSSNLGESLVNDLGDIDVVRACGMAGQSNPLGLSIWRWRYAGDERELWKVAEGLVARGRPALLVMRVLHHLADDVCKVCWGRGYGVIEGAPVLNGEQCVDCRGTGRLEIQGEAEQALVEEIAALEREVAGNIMRKLA